MVGRIYQRLGAGVSALLAVALCSAHVSASWLGFRNELNHAVVIQSATTVKGIVRKGAAQKLNPGDVSWEWVSADAAKNIIISDPRPPGKTLHRVVVSPGAKDKLYVISVDTKGGKAVAAVQVISTDRRTKTASSRK